jgi:hypothetical protein
MATPRYADTLRRLELLNDNLRPLVPEMPETRAAQARLEIVVAALLRLDAEQSELRGQLLETTRMRRETMEEGEEVRGRIASVLRARFGPQSAELIGFGVKPRRPIRPTASGLDPLDPLEPEPDPVPPPPVA